MARVLRLLAGSVAISTLLLFATATSAQTQASCSFQYFQLNPNDGNNPQTVANAVNSYSTVVGQAIYPTNSPTPKGFLRWSTGGISYFNPSGSIWTEFTGRNDKGESVGNYTTSIGGIGFLLQGSTLTTISHPNAVAAQGGTHLGGINKWTSIVGYYMDSAEHAHGFKRWSNGNFGGISYPNATDTMPNSINGSNWIVGSYTDNTGVLHGFVDENGSFATLDFPSTTGTELFSISDNGKIIGLDHSTEQGRTFLYENGAFKVISAPNSFYTHATGISPNGHIVTGNVLFNGSNTQQGFLAVCQ